jgi:hypothetical protein
MIPLGLAMGSCSSIKSPEGTIWVIDTKSQTALGVPFNEVDNPSASSITEPLSYLNGAVCFENSDWANIQYWTDQLRNHQCH